jgi:hypothetical protein
MAKAGGLLGLVMAHDSALRIRVKWGFSVCARRRVIHKHLVGRQEAIPGVWRGFTLPRYLDSSILVTCNAGHSRSSIVHPKPFPRMPMLPVPTSFSAFAFPTTALPLRL